jgi:hypothetical protein
MNDIGRVEVETTLPLFFDIYREIRSMGSFILIDPLSNATVAAGMIEEAIQSTRVNQTDDTGNSVVPVSVEERAVRFRHPSALIWVGGDPKLAQLIERQLFENGWFVHLICASEHETSDLVSLVRAFRSAGMLVILSVDGSNDHGGHLRELVGPRAFFHAAAIKKSRVDAASAVIQQLEIWRETATAKANGAS